jgi:hypothetical protein
MKRSGPDRAAHAVAGMMLAAALLAPSVAFALACDARAPHVQFARDNLRRAASEGDLPTAQDYADRARRQMEQLARGAERCGCPVAQPVFEAAAAELRKARDAESRRQVRDIVARVQPRFEEAMAALRACAAE